ncbi:MAG: alkaline phosphatase D, partial [Maricaulis maris]
MTFRILAIAMLTILVAACSHLRAPSAEPVAAEAPPVVIMVGLDGLRFDAIDRHEAPNLRALAARGTRPERMVSAMPTKTFVNFYTLATGLYPEHHGMVSNSPYDRR